MRVVSPDLIIFDCDGVLIDSEAIACRADSVCLAEIGIALSAEEIMDRYLGISAAAMCADIEQRHGRALPADFAETLRLRVAAAFESELVPMAGVESVLAALAQRRCVASSSAPERLRHSLSLTGLLRCCAGSNRMSSARRKWLAASRRPTCSSSPPPRCRRCRRPVW